MKKFVEYFIRHSAVTNWIMLIICAAGIFGLYSLNRRLDPKMEIENIEIDKNRQSLTRTAIGIGLASAVNRLLKINDNDKTESKIVILVTDGINNAGEISPQTATEIARKSGIKVYTVGIGHYDDVDLGLLRYIAKKTGGISYHAKTSGELGPIFEEINKIEKHKIETYTLKDFNNIGYKISIFGIILMLAGILLNTLFFKRL